MPPATKLALLITPYRRLLTVVQNRATTVRLGALVASLSTRRAWDKAHRSLTGLRTRRCAFAAVPLWLALAAVYSTSSSA